MTWNCPACRTTIQHNEEPRPGVIYRCPICRLELVVDTDHDKLTLAPFPTEERPATLNKTAAVPSAEVNDTESPKEKPAKLPRSEDRFKTA